DESVEMVIHGLTYPDVTCMLPPDGVRRAAVQLGTDPSGFGSWDELIAAHQRHRASMPEGKKPSDFKQFLLEVLGLQGRIGFDEFLGRVIDGLEQDDEPHPELHRLVAEVTAAVVAQPERAESSL